ncbi:MAG: tRNA (adenosine(37)-N6)-dimethylallyltransferase MiaA [Kiloniellales bacterium]
MSDREAPVWAIVGPTASGKSALAVDLAEAFGGVVINADALQLYRELPILTAQPDQATQARVPHRLYGIRSASEPASAGLWCALAKAEIERARAAGLRPLLAGGSGLYLRALSQGLAPIPPLSEAQRAETLVLLQREGPEALHRRLTAADPETAAKLSPADTQRLQRAWSVLQASGRGLVAWQRRTEPGVPLRWLILLPEREVLRNAVAQRFDAMLAAGALDEVRALFARKLDPSLPALKAVGYRELAAHLAGEISLQAACEAAVTATRRYLKRQTTWLRHQVMADETQIGVWHAQYSCQLSREIVTFLREER